MRFLGSSAPAIGAGPAGQLDSLRIPALIAAAKLIASFFARPATSLGAMLSPGAGAASAAGAAPEGVATSDGAVVADGVFAVAGGVPMAAMESAVVVAPLPAGAGVDETSPALTPERGASATQAESSASESAPTRDERTEDM